MKASKAGIITKRNLDSNIQDKQHRFMLQAGMIHMTGAGLYSWLPLGLRALNKLKKIIATEMEKIGALEIAMPHLLPEELLKKSGRLHKFGQDIFRLQDRHTNKLYCAPTHEEPIVEIAASYINSYKHLPLTLYQIQEKLRDETRPRGGLMRAREFMMKDAYSFHQNAEELTKTYSDMMQAYCNILRCLELPFLIVDADPGNIFGDITHEFHIESEIGEDILYVSKKGDYAANLEVAEYLKETTTTNKYKNQPSKRSLCSAYQLEKLMDKQHSVLIKTEIIRTHLGKLVALVLCAQHTLNLHKVKKHVGEFKLLSKQEILLATGISTNAVLGPIELNLPLIVDYTAANQANFICGANKGDDYYIGVNWHVDVTIDQILDIRHVVPGDISPDGTPLYPRRGVEVGHLFQLQDYYSQRMGVFFQDKQGFKKPILMGCYGIGISRLLAVSVEQLSDEKGLIWPKKIAPYALVIIPINFHKNDKVMDQAIKVYKKCLAAGLEVILDDRQLSPGSLLKDAELIGYPYQIIISEKQLADCSFRTRLNSTERDLNWEQLDALIIHIKNELL